MAVTVRKVTLLSGPSALERVLIVGDIHGCLDEFDDLLTAAQVGPAVAVVCVGDLLAKGPHAEALIARLRGLGALSVVGNHDLAVLRRLDDPRDDAQTAAARELSAESVAWLRALPHVLLVDDDLLVVHAGLVPGVPLGQQTVEDVTTVRTVASAGGSFAAAEGCDVGAPWASLWEGPRLAVFGHDAKRKLQEWPHAVGLDTGCVYGGELSALELPSRRIFKIAARRQYAAMKE